ncbi:chaperone modulator CbpM [Rhodobacteraceae bacterium N5(2021)]|uniref:Chaperone modulator CbpM n=1 Tax=Gymnodinialimonas phycosphaerae TaxID=2841589 RepID=A0A975YEG3_9RHOB|nr:chaperone modulator CbpM [Gymnodinialimonas phycosphaerae]MBY4893638.1 chaperone modulator CbpM [Gymnodinialimonas phycosphaerae]
MTDSHDLVAMSELIEAISLIELCRICGSRADWIIQLVDEGILEPEGTRRTGWRFDSASITIVRKVQRLQSDLDVNIPGIAVVLSLVDENARLKRRVQALDRATQVTIPMPDAPPE